MCGIKEEIREYASECGFDACGFAEARPADAAAAGEYRRWIAEGKHFCMDYLDRYSDVRDIWTAIPMCAMTLVCCSTAHGRLFHLLLITIRHSSSRMMPRNLLIMPMGRIITML